MREAPARARRTDRAVLSAIPIEPEYRIREKTSKLGGAAVQENVLILPDGGKDFLRSVRIAALYANHVHVYSPTKQETIEAYAGFVTKGLMGGSANLDDLIDALDDSSVAAMRQYPAGRRDLKEQLEDYSNNHPTRGFLRHCVAYRSELELLQREGVLFSILDQLAPQPLALWGSNEVQRWGDDLKSAIQGIDVSTMPSHVPSTLRGEMAQSSPTICSLFQLGMEVLSDHIEDNTPNGQAMRAAMSDEDIANTYGVATYFLVTCFYAIRSGCAAVTTDTETAVFVEQCLKALHRTQPSTSNLGSDLIRAQLGEMILQESGSRRLRYADRSNIGNSQQAFSGTPAI